MAFKKISPKTHISKISENGEFLEIMGNFPTFGISTRRSNRMGSLCFEEIRIFLVGYP
jgi:hypothetical protein